MDQISYSIPVEIGCPAIGKAIMQRCFDTQGIIEKEHRTVNTKLVDSVIICHIFKYKFTHKNTS